MDRKDKIEKFTKKIGRIAIKDDLNVGEILDALLASVIATLCHIRERKNAENAAIDFARILSGRFPIMYDKITDEEKK